MVRLCHLRSPVGRKSHRRQRLYSLSELSDRVFEEIDEGDEPVSGVEELEDLLRFIAGRRQSSACILWLLIKGVRTVYVQDVLELNRTSVRVHQL
jgi:hypothetical protein